MTHSNRIRSRILTASDLEVLLVEKEPRVGGVKQRAKADGGVALVQQTGARARARAAAAGVEEYAGAQRVERWVAACMREEETRDRTSLCQPSRSPLVAVRTLSCLVFKSALFVQWGKRARY